jgi:hypothetical protein
VTLNVLDLFSGLGGATQAFRDAGHNVHGIDVREDLDPDQVADVRDLEAEALAEQGPWDLVWASPPCTTFSVMTISVYHDGDGYPAHPLTHERLALVHDTLSLIYELEPAAWVMENPVGMLRNQDFMGRWPRRTVTYCQYGHFLRKATDLWGCFPPTWQPRDACSPGDPCHASSPRDLTDADERPDRADWDCTAWGAAEEDLRDAWMRKGNKLPSDPDRSALRALVPYQLSEELCEAMEAWDPSPGLSWQDRWAEERTTQQRLTEVTR